MPTTSPITRWSRRHTLLAGAALLSGSARAADAAWPGGPVVIHTPYGAGGTSHNLSGVVAAQMSISLGNEVPVQARPDQTLTSMAQAVATAPPDGRTALLVSNVFVRAAVASPSVGYEPFNDFRPVGLIARSELALVTHPRTGVRSLSQMLGAARQQHRTLRAASFGKDSTSDGALAQLRQLADVDMPVNHFQGQAPAVEALLAGEQDLVFINLPELQPLLRQHRVVPLAIAARSRSTRLPQVPKLTELGYPIVFAPWYGLLVPAQTPDAVVEAFNRELNAAIGASVVNHVLLAAGVRPEPGTPARLREAMQDEVTLFRVQSRALAARNSAPARKP